MKRFLLLVAALFMAAGGAYADLIGQHEGGEFDGSTVAVDTEIEVGMTPGDPYSISGWITTESGEGWIFGVANCGEDGVYGNNSNGIYMDGGGYTYDMWWVGNTGTGDQGLNDGTQHHVAYTLDDAGNVTLYADGAEVGDGSGFDWPEHEPGGVYTTVTMGFSGEADGSPGDDACDVGVGDDGWPGAFTGTIEDVRVYDHALDAGEVADLFDAGPGPGAPVYSASITGPHNVDVGASVVLEVVTEGFDEGTETYLWNDDSTAATLDLGVVDGGDTGVYTCEVGGDVEGEAVDPIEASFTLWVGVATPLAGGLGLGLLAGACALAGAVSIRRKK